MFEHGLGVCAVYSVALALRDDCMIPIDISRLHIDLFFAMRCSVSVDTHDLIACMTLETWKDRARLGMFKSYAYKAVVDFTYFEP